MSTIKDFQVVRTKECIIELYACHDAGLPEPDSSFREREIFKEDKCYGSDEDYFYKGDELQFTNGKIKCVIIGYSGTHKI